MDNAPPPEPHDVRAHLHGGVPLKKINALSRFWANYPGLRESIFEPRMDTKEHELEKARKTAVSSSVVEKYGQFAPAINSRRDLAGLVQADPAIAAAHEAFRQTLARWWEENLPHVAALAPVGDQKATSMNSAALLTDHHIRGALARYFELFKPELKSIAFSGWGAELIPDDAGVLPGEEVKRLKAELKELKARAKLAKKEGEKGDWHTYTTEAAAIEEKLERHKALEDEAKQLKAEIRATEKRRDDLVAAARAKIDAKEAQKVILALLRRVLFETYDTYLRADSRQLLAALENLHATYAVTAKDIEAERNHAAAKLKSFLEELGYE